MQLFYNVYVRNREPTHQKITCQYLSRKKKKKTLRLTLNKANKLFRKSSGNWLFIYIYLYHEIMLSFIIFTYTCVCVCGGGYARVRARALLNIN